MVELEVKPGDQQNHSDSSPWTSVWNFMAVCYIVVGMYGLKYGKTIWFKLSWIIWHSASHSKPNILDLPASPTLVTLVYSHFIHQILMIWILICDLSPFGKNVSRSLSYLSVALFFFLRLKKKTLWVEFSLWPITSFSGNVWEGTITLQQDEFFRNFGLQPPTRGMQGDSYRGYYNKWTLSGKKTLCLYAHQTFHFIVFPYLVKR